MKYILILVVIMIFSTFTYAFFSKSKVSLDDKPKDIYDYAVNLIDGKQILLENYKGKKIIFVNVASKCGYTPQYKGLQELYEKFSDQLVIIGFPANDFLWQEPAANEKIKQFCSTKYDVSFPMFEKIGVKKNKNQHPVYTWLSNKLLNGWNEDAPSWNFCKYLIDENGKLIQYYPSKISPLNNEIIKHLTKSKS